MIVGMNLDLFPRLQYHHKKFRSHCRTEKCSKINVCASDLCYGHWVFAWMIPQLL